MRMVRIAVASVKNERYYESMRSIIIPVFSEADLQALRNCLRFLGTLPDVENVLVLHGPNVGILNADATKEIDAKIEALSVRKKELTLVEDFIGAAKAKEDIEGLKVERDIAIREGWKSIPEEKRPELYKKAFGDIGTEPICLREAYQPDQLFDMLRSFLPQWPSDIPHGEYAIVWPRSVGAFKSPAQKLVDQWIEKAEAKSDPTLKQFAPSPILAGGREHRAQELKSMHHMKAIAAAQQAGIVVKGKKVSEVIELLLAKEYPNAA